MELYHEIREKAYIIILAGSLDGYHAGEITNMLNKAIKSRKKNILVDCSKLITVSSSGMGIFLSYLPGIKVKQMNLIFFGMNAGVRKVFTLLGLDTILNIQDNIPEAYYNAAHS